MVRKTYSFIAIMALALSFAVTTPAQAQESAPQKQPQAQTQAPPPAARSHPLYDNEIYLQLPREDQERLIEEATYLFDYCNKRENFAYLHDCACVAAKAMEVRLNDPESKKTIVAVGDDVADECPNGPGAAGYAYAQCESTYVNIMPYGLEEFCTCYANEFGRGYIKEPRSFKPHLRKLGVAALTECRKKDIPHPLDFQL